MGQTPSILHAPPPAPQQRSKPWLEADAEASRLRAAAQREQDLRHQASQQSQSAYHSGQHTAAARYSALARSHQAESKRLDAAAAKRIFRHFNRRYPGVDDVDSVGYKVVSYVWSWVVGEKQKPAKVKEVDERVGLARVDLHGLKKEEAREVVREHLRLCRKARVAETVVVTGRGNRSGVGGAVIRPMVDELLAKENVRVARQGEGAVVVEFLEEGWVAGVARSLLGWIRG